MQALPCLVNLISGQQKKSIKKEAVWTISNITAGNKDQIQAVIDANIVPYLVYHLEHSEFDIKKEAAWAISNATSGGTHNQIKFLVNQGCIPPLCNLLNYQDMRVVTVALEGLENILKVGETEKEMHHMQHNEYADAVEACGGVNTIEQLQYSGTKEVYDKVMRIIVQYFGMDEEEDAETVTADEMGGSQSFNIQSTAESGGYVPQGGFSFG
jgi:hypothetical protein